VVDFHQEVVVVDFLALIRIVRGALNWVGMGRASAGHEVGDAAVLVTFVVVDVSREDDKRARV